MLVIVSFGTVAHETTLVIVLVEKVAETIIVGSTGWLEKVLQFF